MNLGIALLIVAVAQFVLTIRIIQLFGRLMVLRETVEDLVAEMRHAKEDLQAVQSDLSSTFEQLTQAQATAFSAVNDVGVVAGTVKKIGEKLKERGYL